MHEIDAGALDMLRAYPWPGNVRQLENAVERMVLLAGGAVLRRADVPEEILYAEEDEAVGLSRKSLYAKLEHLDIDYQCYRFRS